jgi:hypothetical protein
MCLGRWCTQVVVLDLRVSLSADLVVVVVSDAFTLLPGDAAGIGAVGAVGAAPGDKGVSGAAGQEESEEEEVGSHREEECR